jgi:HAD superfamily phosphatase
MVKPDLLVFDMDGVLVDVRESYRETILQTVEHFSGRRVTRELVQNYKDQGGWNNDWALSQRILRDLGVEVEYETVVELFNRFFFGEDGSEGLIQRELWIGEDGLFERLAGNYQLAIFTGRMRYELTPTLDRFARDVRFDPTICADDVTLPKPDPEGLLKIGADNPGKTMLYFGDVVDDARSARAAGVPFVAVIAAHHLDREQQVRRMGEEGAIAVIESVNEIEDLLR